ncbi:hypothetical protein MN116_008792 [Schistosoma mekongi]|uniref:Uncharacterized protein n=1 Tax=Schistosoma mekongi TaxID=38744 RepID=A0AAE2D1F9_SCHME|nr:hypothetical protein MN116_008792 [Schistosoma mekongi]
MSFHHPLQLFSRTSRDHLEYIKRISILCIIFILLKCITSVISSSKSLNIEYDTPLTINFIPNSNEVILYKPLIIRCELHALHHNLHKNVLSNTFSMFFQCPLVTWGKFCFHNCQSACIDNEFNNQCPYSNELNLIQCRKSINQYGYYYYEYTITNLTQIWLPTTTDNTTNKYYNENDKINSFSCKTGGLETPKITLKLSKSIKQTPSPAPTTTPTTINQSINLLNTHLINQQNLSIKSKLINQFNESIHHSDIKIALTREILIIGAIIVVLISVVLNVFCCIRCALIRQYSNSKERAHMQHLFCMAEEIRNARLVKQINGKGRSYRDKIAQQQQLHGLTHLLHDNRGRGNSLLLMNKIQSQSNGYESYQPSIDYGSEYMTGINCPGYTFNDNHSSSGLPIDLYQRYLPDGKSGNRQSISAFSLVPGQIPLSWTNGSSSNGINHNTINNEAHHRSISSIQRTDICHGISNNRGGGGGGSNSGICGDGNNSLTSQHSSQQQITAAITNFYLQHQQHFLELQNHLNNNLETSTIHQLGSDGITSCFDSIDQPDSSNLSEINNNHLININNFDKINYQSINQSPIIGLRNNNNNNLYIKGKLSSSSSPSSLRNTSMIQSINNNNNNNHSNYIIPNDTIINNQLITNFSHKPLSPINNNDNNNNNRSQPIGLSQSQLAILINQLHNTTTTTAITPITTTDTTDNNNNNNNNSINSPILINKSILDDTLNSQFDSGTGTDSGKMSIDSSSELKKINSLIS